MADKRDVTKRAGVAQFDDVRHVRHSQPVPGAILLFFAFRWQNHAFEYSADRAGWLACGKPEKATS